MIYNSKDTYLYKERDRETDRQDRDRQIDRQTDRQIDIIQKKDI